MPRGDGTGPWGAAGGWMCRRGKFGAGFGRGPGFGAGRGLAAYPVQDQQESAADLKSYVGQLESELAAVKKRLAQLEKK